MHGIVLIVLHWKVMIIMAKEETMQQLKQNYKLV